MKTKFLYCYNCRIGQLMKRVAVFPSGTEFYRCLNCKQQREFAPIAGAPRKEDDEFSDQ
jgi:hypothetical protein